MFYISKKGKSLLRKDEWESNIPYKGGETVNNTDKRQEIDYEICL